MKFVRHGECRSPLDQTGSGGTAKIGNPRRRSPEDAIPTSCVGRDWCVNDKREVRPCASGVAPGRNGLPVTGREPASLRATRTA